MTTKHERKRWKSKRGRRTAATAQTPPAPPTPRELQDYARALADSGIRSTAVLGSRPKTSTTHQ